MSATRESPTHNRVVPISAVLILLTTQTPAVKVTSEHVTKKGSWYEAETTTPKYVGAGKLGTFAAKVLRDAAKKDLAQFILEAKPEPGDHPANPYGYEWNTIPSISKSTLISTYTELYSYAGGAHPNHGYITHTFGMIDGKPKQLRFGDLMRTRMLPKKVVSDLVIPRLDAMGASNVVSGEITEVPDANVDNFVITPAGITWIFSPYDVGAYVEGDFFVKVPWSELMTHLNPNGPLKGVMPAGR
jgi:hypothetical protein